MAVYQQVIDLSALVPGLEFCDLRQGLDRVIPLGHLTIQVPKVIAERNVVRVLGDGLVENLGCLRGLPPLILLFPQHIVGLDGLRRFRVLRDQLIERRDESGLVCRLGQRLAALPHDRGIRLDGQSLVEPIHRVCGLSQLLPADLAHAEVDLVEVFRLGEGLDVVSVDLHRAGVVPEPASLADPGGLLEGALGLRAARELLGDFPVQVTRRGEARSLPLLQLRQLELEFQLLGEIGVLLEDVIVFPNCVRRALDDVPVDGRDVQAQIRAGRSPAQVLLVLGDGLVPFAYGLKTARILQADLGPALISRVVAEPLLVLRRGLHQHPEANQAISQFVLGV